MSYRKFSCQVCDHLYDEEKGDPDSGGATKGEFQVVLCELS